MIKLDMSINELGVNKQVYLIFGELMLKPAHNY